MALAHCQNAVANVHPFAGGKKILQRVAGKDASKQFWKYHNEGILKKFKSKLQVGSLDTKKAEPAPAPVPKKEVPKKPAKPAESSSSDSEESEPLEPFGDQIPFGDPNWYQNVGPLPHMTPALRGSH